MKTAVRFVVLLSLMAATFAVAQTDSPPADDEVLVRLTAEPMPGSVGDVPVTLRRVDQPGPPIDLVATPGAVDAAVIAPGVYELVSQTPVEINGQQFRWQMQIPIFDHITRVRLSLANAIAVSSAATAAPSVAAATQSNMAGAGLGSEAKPAEPFVEVELRIDPALSDSSGSETPVELRRLDRRQPPITSTISNGIARLRVAPGTYQIVTPKSFSAGAHEYYWDMEAPLTDPVNRVQLSEWQALVLNSNTSQRPATMQHAEQVSGRNHDPMK